MRITPALLLLPLWCGVLSGAVRSERVSPPTVQGSFLLALRDSLRTRSPAIEHVSILEVRTPSAQSGRRAVLAWGIRNDRQFHGSLDDELFGVFVANDSLTRVLRTVALIPTRRWLDYDVRLDRVTADSIYVVGQGATYGDQPFHGAYAW